MAEHATIRTASEQDCLAINDIYNYYVRESTSTWQTEPSTLPERLLWLQQHGPQMPAFVAEINGVVVGWASLSPYRPREGWRFTVENSVYIHHAYQRRGIGGTMLQQLIQSGTELGFHSIVAAIDGEQSGSIAIHEKYGFVHAGVLKQSGYKFGRWLDSVFLQKILK